MPTEETWIKVIAICVRRNEEGFENGSSCLRGSSFFLAILNTSNTLAPGEGLPDERGGDARRLA